MSFSTYSIEQDQDVEMISSGDAQGFDNLLADEVIAEWLSQLEQEQCLHAAVG